MTACASVRPGTLGYQACTLAAGHAGAHVSHDGEWWPNPDGVRALTVRQPWAHAIVWWGKDVENRGAGFPTRYRGLVLIHAGAAWSERGAHDDRVRHAATVDQWPLDIAGFTRSAIIGAALLNDVHQAVPGCCAPWGEFAYLAADGTTTSPVTHLELDSIVALPDPIPCPGALGLWRPPTDLLSIALDQLDSIHWPHLGDNDATP